MKENDPTAPITIVCRGTAFDASIIADIDLHGPGVSCIESQKKVLFDSGISQFIRNRIETHSDFFYHEKKKIKEADIFLTSILIVLIHSMHFLLRIQRIGRISRIF